MLTSYYGIRILLCSCALALIGPLQIFAKSITSILEKNTFEDEVWMLAFQIVKKYFENEYLCLTYISSDLEEPWPLKTKLPVLSIDLTDDYSQDDIILQSYNDGCGGYIIRSKPERKEEIINSLYLAFTNATNFRYNTQKYLYLPYDENDQEVSVLNIKEMFWFPELNMVTLHSSNPYNFSIISHNWFHGHKYDTLGIKYEAIDYWTAKKGFELKIDLYYNRMLNVHGKKLYFALIHYIPYTLILKDESNRTYYDGLETRIAAMYVELINGTWDAFDHPVHFWGDVHADGHADGILGSVMYHRADFGFAAVYQWHCDAVACSYPYVYAEVTCLVPRPHRRSGWLTVVLPFTPHTWLGLIITYLISSTFVFFLMSAKEQMKGKDYKYADGQNSGQTLNLANGVIRSILLNHVLTRISRQDFNTATSTAWRLILLSCTKFFELNNLFLIIFTATEAGKKKPFLSGIIFLDAYYNTFRLQIEQIPKIAARKDSIGVYFKFCNVYYFFVACCWIGGIASLLTLPR